LRIVVDNRIAKHDVDLERCKSDEMEMWAVVQVNARPAIYRVSVEDVERSGSVQPIPARLSLWGTTRVISDSHMTSFQSTSRFVHVCLSKSLEVLAIHASSNDVDLPLSNRLNANHITANLKRQHLLSLTPAYPIESLGMNACSAPLSVAQSLPLPFPLTRINTASFGAPG